MQVPNLDKTPSKLVNSILDAGKERYPNEHPFQQMFLNGELTKEQLQKWAINRYYFHAGIPQKDREIFAKLPNDPEVYSLFIEKLEEEAGTDEEISHPELFINFCKGLDLSRDDVINGEVFPEIKMAVDSYAYAARVKEFEFSLGASLSEVTVPKKVSRMLPAFKKHYSFIPEEALEFFTLHGTMDIEHGKIMTKLTDRYGNTDKAAKLFKEGYFFKLDLHQVILSSCYHRIVCNK